MTLRSRAWLDGAIGYIGADVGGRRCVRRHRIDVRRGGSESSFNASRESDGRSEGLRFECLGRVLGVVRRRMGGGTGRYEHEVLGVTLGAMKLASVGSASVHMLGVMRLWKGR